jgi:hypothetical protein
MGVGGLGLSRGERIGSRFLLQTTPQQAIPQQAQESDYIFGSGENNLQRFTFDLPNNPPQGFDATQMPQQTITLYDASDGLADDALDVGPADDTLVGDGSNLVNNALVTSIFPMATTAIGHYTLPTNVCTSLPLSFYPLPTYLG